MADLTYKVTADVGQAERSLSNLQKTVGGLNDTFVKLRTTIASISLGAVINQSLQFADAISDLSDATEIGVANVLGFSKAVEASGGSAESAQKGLLKLVNSIGEAADGSAALQAAFKNVGVTVDDLRNATNEDILKKTIAGLDGMNDSARRSVLITQLLGKEFRNVAPGQLGAAYAAATAQSEKYADAITKGAAAQQNIDKTLGEFKVGLLEALKPLTELVSSVNIGVENFQRFVQAILAVGAVLATVFVGGKIIAGVRLLWAAVGALFEAFASGISIAVNFVRNFQAIITNIGSASSVFNGIRVTVMAVFSAIAEALTPAFLGLKAIATPVLAGIAGYWGWIQESTGKAIDKLREYASALTFGLISPPQGAGAGRGNGQAELDQRRKDAEEALKKQKALREVLDREEQARSKVNLELRQTIDNLAIGLSRQREAIWNDTRLIELSKLRNVISEDEVEIYRAQSQASVERLAAIKKLEQEQEKLRLNLKYAKDEEKAGLEAQIAANDILIKKTKEYYQGHEEGLREVITYQQTVRQLDADRLQTMENIKKAIEDQISRQQTLGDIIRQANDQVREALNAPTAQQTTGLTELQRQILEIQQTTKRAAREAARSFAAAFEDTGDGMTPEKAQELAAGLDQIAAAYKRIADAQIQVATTNSEYAKTFEAGWKDAFSKFKEDAFNNANQAKTIFDTFSRGFGDAIVKFVQTGKLSFRDLANSLLAEVARMAANRLLVSIIGGLGSSFGGTFGELAQSFIKGFRANGGPVGAGQAYVVGEQGPELFVPKSNGTVVPNGVAMGGGQNITQVTYNIQAVDASSFRSLVARDPEFIYNVTEQGRRSLPTRSRR